MLFGKLMTPIIRASGLRGTTLIWSVSFIAIGRLELVSGDINKLFERVTIAVSKFSNRVLVLMTPKSTSIYLETI